MLESTNEELTKAAFPLSVFAFPQGLFGLFFPDFALTICGFSVASPSLAGSTQGLHKAGLENQEKIRIQRNHGISWAGTDLQDHPIQLLALHGHPKISFGRFHLGNLIFMAIWFNICLSPTPQPPIFLAHFSPRAPFPLGFHSSKWTRDGLNNTEIFIFMQNPGRTLWCH